MIIKLRNLILINYIIYFIIKFKKKTIKLKKNNLFYIIIIIHLHNISILLY